ncbi:thioredoxin family protein [Aquimarina sp. ERC-38]|uniref:protein-disulfide reductase DsbD family protein n=1 Tax=Aquimarina sp. ERC-38 TaxID=2949996 RepID=UPI002245484F|nr:thioredoxin family protein [Aquimarina sp. ERC-38]UZO80019.1 thioredoxin family protein [Aquimarina sp. ERC-38]
MNKYFWIIILALSTFLGHSQIFDPVQWNATIEKADDHTFTLGFKAKIEENWHVYSQKEYPEDAIAPIPLSLDFKDQEKKYELIGITTESETKTSFNDVFKLDETYFVNSAFLQQIIKFIDTPIPVKVEIKYQVCKEVCLNESAYFIFTPASLKAQVVEASVFEGKEENVSTVPVITPSFDQSADTNTAVNSNTTGIEEEQNLWALFFIAFLSGFAALLTPCVFPMIPMTVSFFTKQSKTKASGIRNAIFYAIFIIVIYVGLGSIVTAIFGADALNSLSTNVWFNLVFFLLLLVFGFSFLGAFEIVLPNSWANKIDRKSERGGVVGIFFMALALAIVSFSCTGPIVGTILVEAASKGGIAPLVGMFGFSLAIALPFAVFALFPGWLQSLPKSGSWLNTVKVFLGFLEIAFAFKFLSNADLVLQLHLLNREIFLAIWIAIFGTLSLYLLGKIKLPHDSPLPFISVGRLSLALLSLAFTLYLIPGLWGAPLKLISGFPPPSSYSESPRGLGTSSPVLLNDQLPEGATYGEHDLIVFKDYQDGLAYAKRVNKPALLDFTGYACVNCRKMEENVWSQPEVLRKLREEVVLISLYVDYKKELPEAEQYISKTTGKKIKTIGNKWSDFQIERYAANAQPYYVLIDHNQQNLNAPIGYTPDATDYLSWLKEGIGNF